MDVSTLSDEELNRAMIWLHPHLNDFIGTDTGGKVWVGPIRTTNPHWSYLLNWNLTGPLMVSLGISLDVINNNGFVSCEATDDTGYQALDVNPLRAICECILMIELASD